MHKLRDQRSPGSLGRLLARYAPIAEYFVRRDDRWVRICSGRLAPLCMPHPYQYEKPFGVHSNSGGSLRLCRRVHPGSTLGYLSAAGSDASRRQPAGTGAGVVVPGGRHRRTVSANLAHGLGHDPIGALVSAWSALALVGSFELLMMHCRAAVHGLAGRGCTTGARPSPGRSSSGLTALAGLHLDRTCAPALS